MVRLTEEAKKFIKGTPDVSHRKLAEMIGLELQLKVSHTAVANYRKKIEKEESVKLSNVTSQKPSISKKPKKSNFPLSIDQVNSLLKANKGHYWYEHLNYQINGITEDGKKKGGRLRSDFQKFLEFVRDTAPQ